MNDPTKRQQAIAWVEAAIDADYDPCVVKIVPTGKTEPEERLHTALSWDFIDPPGRPADSLLELIKEALKAGRRFHDMTRLGRGD